LLDDAQERLRSTRFDVSRGNDVDPLARQIDQIALVEVGENDGGRIPQPLRPVEEATEPLLVGFRPEGELPGGPDDDTVEAIPVEVGAVPRRRMPVDATLDEDAGDESVIVAQPRRLPIRRERHHGHRRTAVSPPGPGLYPPALGADNR